MAIKININQIQTTDDGIEVFGTLTFSGNYPTGGDTLDWTTVVGSLASPNGRIFLPQTLPYECQINGSNGRTFGYVAGTTLANSKVKVLSAADTEISATGYPAGVTGDVNIYFDAAFAKLL